VSDGVLSIMKDASAFNLYHTIVVDFIA